MSTTTPLLALGTTADGGAKLVGKSEHLAPLGTHKHRIAAAVQELLTQKLREASSKQPHWQPRVLVHGTPLFCLVLAQTARQQLAAELNIALLAVVSTSTPRELVALLEGLQVRVILEDNASGVAQRLAKQLEGSIVVDEKELISKAEEIYAPLAASILSQVQALPGTTSLQSVFVAVESGLTLHAFTAYLAKHSPSTRVVGVSLELAAGLSSKMPLSPMLKSKSLAPEAEAEIAHHPRENHVRVDANAAYSASRALLAKGHLVGPLSGATFVAAEQFQSAPSNSSTTASCENVVVVLFSDAATFYTSTLLNNEWLMSNNFGADYLLRNMLGSATDKYRGAAVADLLSREPSTVKLDDPLVDAFALCEGGDFDFLPVLDDRRRLVGFITRDTIKAIWAPETEATPVRRFMHAIRSASAARGSNHQQAGETDIEPLAVGLPKKLNRYTKITPETSLLDLAKFFEKNRVAFVTDESREWCLGVLTKYDLYEFLAKRG